MRFTLPGRAKGSPATRGVKLLRIRSVGEWMLVRGRQGKSKISREPMIFIYSLISGLLGLGVLMRIAVAL